MSAKYCSECGAKLSPLAKFCPSCGVSTSGLPAKTAPVVTPPASRVRLASELRGGRSNSATKDTEDDDYDEDDSDSDSVPVITKLDVVITDSGSLHHQGGYSAKRFKGSDLFNNQ